MSLVSDADIALLNNSGEFDVSYYKETYRDIDTVGLDPITHYLWIGCKLGRNPNPRFSTADYLLLNPDVAHSGINPFIHYIKSGKKEKRIANLREPVIPGSVIDGIVPLNPQYPNVLLCAHEAHSQIFGSERSFLDMLKALAALKVNVFVVLPSDINKEYINMLRKFSSCILIFKYHVWTRNAPISRDIINEFMRIIVNYNINTVYVNTIMLREAQIAAMKLSRGSICHVRELVALDEHLRKRTGGDADSITRSVIERSTHIIANSKITADNFKTAKKLVVAPNIVEADDFDIPNTFDDAVTFGIISSNIPKKGIADFIEIAKRVQAAKVKAKFSIIGPMNDYVAELTKKGLPKNVQFAGYAATPRQAIEKVNVVLSLSHFAESFGRTVAEAQIARRPVIAYQWGAVPELVDHGQTGFLVPYLDIDAATAAVIELATKPDLVRQMGELGRERIKRTNASHILRDALAATLSDALKQPIEERAATPPRTTVVIAVYNAPDDVRACLESVRRWTNLSNARILVINDGSTSPDIAPILAEFATVGGFTVVNNEKNIGYTRTINKGIALAEQDDVILLNSDTIVTPHWLEGLRDVAYSREDVGTVTAMSDNAGAFSFPVIQVRNEKPDFVSHELWAALILRHAEGCNPVDVPTGNGFCLFIKRKVFDAAGTFDEVLFPKGYGEENEFCLRALSKGWRHLISPKAYVFHEKTKSFGAARTQLIEEGAKIVTSRFPSYLRKVKKAFESADMLALRQQTAKVYTAFARSEEFKNLRETKDEGVIREIINDVVVNWQQLKDDAAGRDDSLVSIVICVYNNIELTRKCIEALVRNTEGVKTEIIIVDNGSAEEVGKGLESLERTYYNVRLINNYGNLNFSMGNNVGFAASKGAKVVFLNNDTEVSAGWLEPLLAELDNPQVMGAQPRLLYPDGRLQCVGVVFSDNSTLGYTIYANQENKDLFAGKARKFRAITAACIAVRARDFIAAKGFDPLFINGQEDVDLCLRLGSTKAVFSYVPSSVVVHHEGKTAGRGKFLRHNRRVFVDRWRNKVGADDAVYYQDDGVTAQTYQYDDKQLFDQGIGLWRPKELQLEAK